MAEFDIVFYFSGAVSNTEIQKDCTPDNCTLTCKGMGDGDLTYTWYNEKGDDTPGPVLTVQRDKEKDQVYTCKLSNPVSEDSRNVTVQKVVVESQTGQKAQQVGCFLSMMVPVLFVTNVLSSLCSICSWSCNRYYSSHSAAAAAAGNYDDIHSLGKKQW